MVQSHPTPPYPHLATPIPGAPAAGPSPAETDDGLTVSDLVDRGILADEPANTIRGRALRFLIVDELRTHDVLSVAEMITIIAHHGFHIPGRPSKTISDALRWERARGRVVRISRGLYRYGHAPSTTARRIKLFALRCRAWLVAPTRSQPHLPPRTHPTSHAPHRANHPSPPTPARGPDPPTPPPWNDLRWLWST